MLSSEHHIRAFYPAHTSASQDMVYCLKVSVYLLKTAAGRINDPGALLGESLICLAYRIVTGLAHPVCTWSFSAARVCVRAAILCFTKDPWLDWWAVKGGVRAECRNKER